MTTVSKEEFRTRRERWLQAMESGAWPQTAGFLNMSYGDGTTAYCALGVACEVAPHDSLNIFRLLPDGWTTADGHKYQHTLPGVIRDYYGLTDDGHARVWFLNDRSSMTFAEIAKEIRAHPQLFFREGTY